MKSRTKELVDRAIAATISAIEIYNKPDFQYRAETFCILVINGWELLFNDYHKIRKSICETKKEKVCKIRYIDPSNPKSTKKEFYKSEILEEFDKHYSKRGK